MFISVTVQGVRSGPATSQACDDVLCLTEGADQREVVLDAERSCLRLLDHGRRPVIRVGGCPSSVSDDVSSYLGAVVSDELRRRAGLP